jgi:hypothetical protein
MASGKGNRQAMTRTPLLLALAATAALAGCNNDDHTIVAGPDGDAGNQAPAANGPVTLPPSISASKIYRCKDNSVIYVDWLSDGTARVRTDRATVGTGVQVGEGQPLQGSADAPSVTYNGQSCKS